MATKYVDLSLGTSGGNGNSGAPWNFAEFYNDVWNATEATQYKLKGSYTHSSYIALDTVTSHAVVDLSFDAWSLADFGPWRLKAVASGFGSSIIFGSNYIRLSSLSGGILDGQSVSGNCVVSGAVLSNCYFKNASSGNEIFFSNGIVKGCLIEVGNGSYAMNLTCIDSVIKNSGMYQFKGSYTNCAISESSWSAGSRTLTNCQTGVTLPTLPAWDALRSAFDSVALSVNILSQAPNGATGKPNPGIGAPTYSGYATGLWGTPRIGIGAMDFPAAAPKVSSFSSPTVADGSTVTSTIDVSGTVSFLTAAFPTDTYFDSTSEVARVDVYYTHSEGRHNKRFVHQAPGFTSNASWSAYAKDGTWVKTKVIAFDWEGALVNLDGTNIPSGENLTHASGIMTLNT